MTALEDSSPRATPAPVDKSSPDGDTAATPSATLTLVVSWDYDLSSPNVKWIKVRIPKPVSFTAVKEAILSKRISMQPESEELTVQRLTVWDDAVYAWVDIVCDEDVLELQPNTKVHTEIVPCHQDPPPPPAVISDNSKGHSSPVPPPITVSKSPHESAKQEKPEDVKDEPTEPQPLVVGLAGRIILKLNLVPFLAHTNAALRKTSFRVMSIALAVFFFGAQFIDPRIRKNYDYYLVRARGASSDDEPVQTSLPEYVIRNALYMAAFFGFFFSLSVYRTRFGRWFDRAKFKFFFGHVLFLGTVLMGLIGAGIGNAADLPFFFLFLLGIFHIFFFGTIYGQKFLSLIRRQSQDLQDKIVPSVRSVPLRSVGDALKSGFSKAPDARVFNAINAVLLTLVIAFNIVSNTLAKNEKNDTQVRPILTAFAALFGGRVIGRIFYRAVATLIDNKIKPGTFKAVLHVIMLIGRIVYGLTVPKISKSLGEIYARGFCGGLLTGIFVSHTCRLLTLPTTTRYPVRQGKPGSRRLQHSVEYFAFLFLPYLAVGMTQAFKDNGSASSQVLADVYASESMQWTLGMYFVTAAVAISVHQFLTRVFVNPLRQFSKSDGLGGEGTSMVEMDGGKPVASTEESAVGEGGGSAKLPSAIRHKKLWHVVFIATFDIMQFYQLFQGISTHLGNPYACRMGRNGKGIDCVLVEGGSGIAIVGFATAVLQGCIWGLLRSASKLLPDVENDRMAGQLLVKHVSLDFSSISTIVTSILTQLLEGYVTLGAVAPFLLQNFEANTKK